MQIIRRDNQLTLVTPTFAVTVAIDVRGLDLDATTVGRALHGALAEIARNTVGTAGVGGGK